MPARSSLSSSNLAALAGLLACTLASTSACHGAGETEDFDASAAALAPADASPTVAPDEPPPARQATLVRGVATRGRLTEAMLDPRGEVGLTLDAFGTVQLWPALTGADAAVSSPYTLPPKEPRAMSIAQGGKNRYLVATIDTTDTGHFAQVEVRDGEAVYTELFTLPPSDPLFEAHALDGGERFLVLGIDHRLRLYDRAGKLLSTLDEVGFAPWQLRLSGGVGEPPKLAVVLAQPLRIQRVAITGDVLEVVGDPRPFDLDRGPNLNDLALSPDGTVVACLRRPKARTRQWSIELLDLETGERRLVAGRTDSKLRPRMHFAADDRILLESGSGRGYWVDLAQAEVPPDPADLHPDSRFAERRSKATTHESVRLPGAVEARDDFDGRWDDHGWRMHASVVHGTRLAFHETERGTLVVDPVADAGHLELGFEPLEIAAAGLDGGGERVVWASGGRVWVDAVDGAPGAGFEHDLGEPKGVFFVDDRHVALIAKSGGRHRVGLFSVDGEAIDQRKLDIDWELARADFRDGQLVYAGTRPGTPLRAVEIEASGFGDGRDLGRDQANEWIHVQRPTKATVLAMIVELAGEPVPGLRHDDDLDEWAVDAAGRWWATQKSARTPLTRIEQGQVREVALPAGQGRDLMPSPDGRHIAVVQFREHRVARFTTAEDLLISIYDAETLERQWTRGLLAHRWRDSVDLRWSADGRRVAMLNSGDGQVFDVATGALLAEREIGGLRIVAVAD